MAKGDDDEWMARLRAEIQKVIDAGGSYQQIAKQAGKGRNYVQQMMTNGKSPRADAVAKLCRALGVSVTYIFTGARMTPEAEEMLALWAQLDRDGQESIVKLLKSVSSTPPADEAPQ